MIKRFKIWVLLDWIVGATEQKKLLNWLAMSFALLRNSPLLLRTILGDSGSLVFKEIIIVSPFHAFFHIINVVSEMIVLKNFFTVLW